MTKSTEAQATATDPGASVWVTANAGTGKTHVLTQRVIRLMFEGASPERLLCLTFTKVAAVEMANRLFSTLGAWATLPDDELSEALETVTGHPVQPAQLQLARRLFARALETPGGLKIQTIHAFCERLLRRFPLEAGVAPHFEVLDERTVSELMSQVREDLLAEVDRAGVPELNAALHSVIARASIMKFDSLLREVEDKRQTFAALFENCGGMEGAIEFTRRHLDLDADETVETVLKNAREDFEARRCDVERAAAILLAAGRTGSRETGLTLQRKLREFLDSDGSRADLAGYAELYLTKKDGARRKRIAPSGLLDAQPWLGEFLAAEQKRVYDLSQKLKSLDIFEGTNALLHIAAHFLKLYAVRKRERAGVDFDDLIFYTKDLLRTSAAASWVLYKLDGGLDHILVDEAQDTSPDQWLVIEALGEEFFSGAGVRAEQAPLRARTVFAVGDPKQSIYSFQGADPAEFSRMREKFRVRIEGASEHWEDVELNRSFRSTHPILFAVDEVFSSKDMRKHLVASEDYIDHVTHREGQAGLVEIWPVVQPEERTSSDPWDTPLDQVRVANPRAVLATMIADTIAGWLETGERLESQGRDIEPSDIMILVRRRDAFMDEMIRLLKKRDIPVSGADRMRLTDHIAVMDLIALGEFALLPYDDLTLATVLKSPFIGLSEDDLFELAYGRDGYLWDALASRGNDESVYGPVCCALRQVLRLAGRNRPFDFYQSVLDLPVLSGRDAQSNRTRLLERLGKDSADPINEFLNLALAYERMAAPSLQGFLQWLQFGDIELKRELDMGKKEVRVMTVHAAKGLESPVVFLPDTCDAPDGRHDPQLIETASDAVLWPVRKAADDLTTRTARETFAAARQAEYYRLLYVAMTRAKDRLYVAGYPVRKSVKEGCWYEKVKAALEPSAHEVDLPFGGSGLRITCKQETEPEPKSEFGELESDSLKTQLPRWLYMPAPEEDVEMRKSPSRLTDETSEDSEPDLISPLYNNGRSRYERGRLIHKLLQYLPDIPQAQRSSAAQYYLDRTAGHLTSDLRYEIASETLAVLNHDQFSPVFGPGSGAEVSLVGRVTGIPDTTVVNGQVDRLLIDTSRVLIVDYKTNRTPPLTPSEVSVVYLRQMACYRALLQEITPEKPVDCALLWTDGPNLMPLPAVLLDQALC